MQSTDQPTFIRPGQGHTMNLFPGVNLTTNAGEKIMLSYVTFEDGAVVPLHSHPHEQGGVLLSGQLEFTIGDTTEILNSGDQWIIPGNVLHTVVAVGGPAVALDVFYPIREDYCKRN